MTAKQKTLSLIRAQRDAVTSEAAAERQERWLEALGQLYKAISGWISELEEGGLVSVRGRVTPIREQYLGDYGAPHIDLVMPSGEEVEFVPVGTYILGADGRVDVKGQRGVRKLVWDRGAGWSVAEITPLGQWRQRPFDEEAFWDVVGDLITAPPSAAPPHDELSE